MAAGRRSIQILMFKILVLQALYALSSEATERADLAMGGQIIDCPGDLAPISPDTFRTLQPEPLKTRVVSAS